MTRLKGGDYLVRAAAKASAEVGRSIPLTLAGDGPQRAEWQALAADLGVDASFPGWVSADDRARLLRSASLLAVPSVWPEPFGLVGLEAGAFGVPSVAYDVGGIGEWLAESANGWLAPGDPPTVDGLAALLARAAANPADLAALRPGARAAARRMSLAAHLDRLERILAAAANGGSIDLDPDVETIAGGRA
jgi:glycosyltransferase involved in cell wall biosynthesis